MWAAVGSGLLVALLTLLLSATAHAAPLAGSAYDTGDGDQANGLGVDWQGAATAGNVKESPDANDDCFVGGVKELTPNQWAFNRSAGGCTPGKSNLRVAYTNPESAAATTFGHFAFFRNDTTGNSFLTFELNQTAATWTNATSTTIPCRSNGDLLLSIEVGGSSMTTSLYRWTGDGTGPAACPNGANGTFTGSGAIPASRFQGAMNASAAISNFVNPGAYGATFPANAFGEAAIDLPAVLQNMGASPCFGFLQMQVHSRSSSSISSAMIDYTSPVPVHIQSCAATGTQYQDTNGNGARDAGEQGLAGFRMYVDLDDDGSWDAGEPSGVSDATGFYRILDVPAGSARIRQVPQAGWSCSQPSPCSYARSFTTTGNSTGNDFGNLGPSSASGTTFDDSDGDGARDAGEPGLPGGTVYADLDADGAHDPAEPNGTADGSGAWTVTGIPAGTYAIRPVTPAGRTCSTPAPCSSSHAFSSGSAVTGIVFGSWAAGTIGGTVTETGGAAVAGAQVFLDADDDDAFDLGEPQTTTDAAGAYALTPLAPGAYTVRVTLPSASWYVPGTAEHAVTLTSGVTAGGRDFTLARYATVSGTTWDDADGDGIGPETGEAGLAGFTVWVDYDGDNAIDAGEPSATSVTGGAYAIAGVRAGSWTLRQAPNGAYACTQPSPCSYALVLGSNGSATGRSFGNYVARSVSGTVFDDRDADGVGPEAGESGLQGWVVYADSNNNAALDAGEPTATSNSLGVYNLNIVSNGSYRVRLVGQGGWTCSYPSGCLHTGSLGSGQSDTGKHFGVWGPATISGTVSEDTDADGDADAALSGRTVYVDTDNDGVHDAGEQSTTSNGSGAYSLGGLNPGTYTIRHVLPGGWTCSSPSPCSYTVVTAAGGLTNRNFTSYTGGSISGTVREDTDADGDGDTALSGRTVFLDADGDGTLDGGEASTTSGAAGAYSFSGVAPGSRTVRQVVPGGWTQSAPAAGHAVTVTSGSSTAGRDFASWTTGSIAGSAFEDADFDGSAGEAGDPGLSGRVVYLDADGDGAKEAGEQEATADGSGAFTLAGLRPGSYVVRPVLPGGWACAFPADCAQEVVVASGATASGHDFGSYVGAAVSGTVFEDLDGDGAAREAGEPGSAGRRVYLDGDADGARDASEPTALTAGDGTFSFDGLVAQAWQLRLELSASYACDSPSPCRADLLLTSGASSADHAFGVHTTGTISGHLFTDRDADGGTQAFGENDQPERIVYLDADDDGTRDAGETATTTDDAGDYTFTVQPGAHRVRQVLPAGWTCSTPAPCVRTVTVTSGEAETGHDFSSWTTASFTGVYFEDADADGEYPEPGEDGVAGRTVYVDEDGDGTLDSGDEPQATTSGDGSFAFTGLEPGPYVVRAQAQAAWTCSYPLPCSAALTLEAGERAQDVSFGAWTTATVTGTVSSRGGGALSGWTVYADVDGDGAHDAGEPSDATDGSGAYALSLEPGEHVIRQVVPSGWSCESPDPCEHAVTVVSQQTLSARDFEDLQSAALRGTVYEDADGDATRDAGEAGLSAVTVYVDADGDAALDAGETTAATDSGGAYELAVADGTHSVRVARPAGYECGAPSDCARDAAVAPGATAAGVDFALWRPATISGTVHEDADGDGTRDAGEPGAAGQAVYVDADGDGARDAAEPAATTAGDGTYAISALAPGVHRVRIAAATGWRCATGCSAVETLSSGGTATFDAAVWRPSTVSGTVFVDADADGAAREPGESGAAGVDVYLDEDGDGTPDAGEPRTTTGSDGGYAFADLAPGAYRVRPVVPSGRSCLRPDPCNSTVTATSGSTPAAPDFGLAAVTADLGVTIDRDPAALVAGENATWTIAVTNGGPFAADGATLTITLPADLNGVTWDAAGCTRAGATLTCVLGDLADGGGASVELSGTVDPGAAGASLAVRAVVASDTPDPVAANDEAEDAAVASGSADLRTTATLPATAGVGELVDLEVEVLNAGPSDADDVSVAITLPAGLSLTAPPAGCTAAGQVVTCPAASLGAGDTLAWTIPVRVDDDARDPLVAEAAATADTPDPTPADATDTAATDPVPSADVRVDVEAAPRLVAEGYEYGVVVRNDGPSTATDVVVVDGPFPGGRIVSATTDKGDCVVEPDGRLRCTIGTLADGEQVRIAIVLELDDGVDPQTAHPEPTASAAEGDPAPGNNVRVLALPPVPEPPAPEPQPEPAPEPQPEPEPEPEVASELRVEPAPVQRGGCASSRAFDVKVRRYRRLRVRRVTMTLDGAPLRVTRRKGRFVARVDLRGRPPGKYVLRIRAVTATGRVLIRTRTYTTCADTLPYVTPPL
jgi:uncharacterized repeat protein (TIGR01451 family)